MPKLNIGLFGGSFNPVHKGHIHFANEAIRLFNLDKLILIPNANPPHKDTVHVPFEKRFCMLQLATLDKNRIEISDIEKDLSHVHYTYNTLKKFKAIYQDANLFFIIGTDSFLALDTWYKGFDLIHLANLIVFTRDSVNGINFRQNPKLSHLITTYGHMCKEDCQKIDINKQSSNKIYFIQNKDFNISSTFLRTMLHNYYVSMANLSSNYSDFKPLKKPSSNDTNLKNMYAFLDKKVLDYIILNKLYSHL